MLVIEAHADKGQEITEAIKDACRLARKLSARIDLVFNDRHFYVAPESLPSVLIRQAVEQIRQETGT